MRVYSYKKRLNLFLVTFLIATSFYYLLIPQVHAWGININPPSRVIQPGGTATFTVSISLDPGDPAIPPINLLDSPPTAGITVSFSPNNQAPPFTSTMTVHVNLATPTGTYTLYIWAIPQGTPFPGPGNKQFTVTVDVLTPKTISPPFDFNLELSPPLLEVEKGKAAQYNVIISYSDPAYSGTVITIHDVVGLGPGMTPHLTTVPPGLSISTSPSTPAGTYTITLIGSAQGITRQGSATLIVSSGPSPTEPPPTHPPSTPTLFDFSIMVSPPSQTVKAGEGTEFLIEVAPLEGKEDVLLRVEGVPDNIHQILSTRTGTPPFSSVLTLETSKSNPSGSFTFTIIAEGGGKTKTTQGMIIIEEKVKQAPEISLSASVREGNVIAVFGSISPPISGDTTVRVTYTGPGGERITHEVPIRGGDVFEDSYPGAAPGTWNIISESMENDEYLPARSQSVTVTIEPIMGGLGQFFFDPFFPITILLAIIIVILAITLMRKKKTTTSTPIEPPTRYCANCRAALKPGKAFCNSCGEKAT